MVNAVPTTDTVLTGRYRLVRSLARGGMAEVWEAHDAVLDRPVAVKMLHAHLASDEIFRERFRREAVGAARLSHRNIIATYDTGIDRGLAFIVLELVRGQSLAELLAENRTPPLRRTVEIVAQAADALDHAHRAGIVHRDVKPGNILLCPDGTVKVSDFGIAKAAAGADLTQTGTVLGTTKYLSPEQVEGQPQDGRSDVYALGVVLYEMLCGRPPFSGESDVATAIQHLQTEAVRPRRIRAGIPRSLEIIVQKAMAKSPEERYATAGAMRAALLAVDLADDDATAMISRDRTPPSGTRVEVPRPTGRRTWPVAVALVLAASISAGLLVFVLTASGGRPRTPGVRAGPSGQPLPVTGVGAFDPPPGSGVEHNEELARLVDGDPATTWSTENYGTRRFGNLKDGVGVVVELGSARRLNRLVLATDTPGWSAQVFTADSTRATLGEWGSPVATRSGISGQMEVELGGVKARAVLVWITELADLGDGLAGASIGEVRLFG